MAEISEDDLASMSPEQLKEMQKKNCIFCHIISGRVSSKKVYEDEQCMAILDINPCNPGHLLLLPKDHYAVMPQIPEDLVEHMFVIAKGLSNALLKALQVGGTNIFLANGVSAGQKAPHFMIHIVPRKEGDGINNFSIAGLRLDESIVEEAEKKVKAKLNSLLGLSSQETIEMGGALDLTSSQKHSEGKAGPEREFDGNQEGDVADSHERGVQSFDDSEIGGTDLEDEDVSVEKKLGLNFSQSGGSENEALDDKNDQDKDAKEDVDLDDISSVILGVEK